ncbi:protein Hir2p [[Candida] jaroonii]|uniref:Protein Hir2p n=1 Tax=[Candida] jaroonii TaxID=467808 RepID=A0ACA9YBJ2_9ASCO|nr:protein Hir2p [[Candida] jaroonii]
MRVLIFPKELHSGEIYSLAINLSGHSLLSTGKDGILNVWNVEDLKNLNKTEKSAIQDKIESITPSKSFHNHKSIVKAIKWSPIDPNSFVSGCISGKVILHHLEGEHRPLYPLEGEASSVVDITWSFDGRLIAWSTDDGKVHLFDLTKDTYQELTKLVHQEKPSIQRSIEFDPTNKFLVTLGDDTIICVYQFRYEKNNYQFKILNKITRFMNQNNVNINYSRISWSSNGEFLSIPSAKKNRTTLIALISRLNNWETAMNMVGHGSDCEVVKFNPNFYKIPHNTPERLQEKLDPQKIRNSCVIATAGSDKTLALWNIHNPSPIIVLKELVEKPIVDLCWDKAGESLFLGSLDGKLTIVSFDEGELGIKETDESLIKVQDPPETKAFNAKSEIVNPRSRSSNVVEILDQKDSTLVSETISSTEGNASNNLEEKNGNDSILELDKERHSFIPKVLDSSKFTDHDQSDDLMDNLMDRSKKIKEKESDNEPPRKSSSTNGTSLTHNGSQANRLDVSKQKTTTKDGKRRIQPMLVSNGNGHNDISSLPVRTNRAVNSTKESMEFEKASYSVSDDLFRQIKRQKGNEETNKKQKREMEPTKFLGSVVVNPNTTFSKTRLAVPKIRSGFSLTSTVDIGDQFVLEVKNGSGNDEEPSRLTYFRKDKQIWCDFIPKHIHLATEGQNFWAVATVDGQVLTYYHISGMRILPPLMLGSPIAFLESQGDFLMAITSIGELYVWNVKSKRSHLITPSSINSLLDSSNKYQDEGISKSNRITMCSITSTGTPLITLSNGTGYLFNKDLGTWQTISESWWAFGSHYWNSLSTGDKPGKGENSSSFGESEESIIGLLENKTNEEIIRNTRAGRAKFFNKISKNMLMKEGFENLENTVSLSHLENRILCCELLGETKDFREFFLTYVKRICELGLKAKVFEICNSLVAPEGDSEESCSWDHEICGIKKHDLLKEVILSCSELRDSQRIFTHFAKKVDLL